MIKVGTVHIGNFRYETMQDALQRYMTTNKIADDDVINIVPHAHDPDKLTVFYKERDF